MDGDETTQDQMPVSPEGICAGAVFVMPVVRYRWLWLKRLFDLASGAVLALLLLPVMLLIVAAIRIETPGPVLFRQTRRGWRFRPFTILKFRSLRHSVPDPHAHYEMTETDPRITRIGAWLRRTSLDELPQIFNVLAGSMSLVGPRPLIESESVHCLKRHAARFLMPPGITGLQQVEVRNAVSLDDRSDWDVIYVCNWSIAVDLKILLKTPARVFGEKCIYPKNKEPSNAE